MSCTKPLIGISARAISFPGRNDPVLGAFTSYIESVRAAGGVAIVVPFESLEVISLVDGLLLTGGEDPAELAWWSSGEACGRVDRMRDATEQAICMTARNDNIPTLGICRGAQVINCSLGGRIARFEEASGGLHKDMRNGGISEHRVRIFSGTVNVVSRHNCFISELAPHLRTAAVADDGTIEAFDAPDWDCLGLQWHPEWPGKSVKRDPQPFEWLVRKALARKET
jgi:putative glutamine amidotransferase